MKKIGSGTRAKFYYVDPPLLTYLSVWFSQKLKTFHAADDLLSSRSHKVQTFSSTYLLFKWVLSTDI